MKRAMVDEDDPELEHVLRLSLECPSLSLAEFSDELVLREAISESLKPQYRVVPVRREESVWVLTSLAMDLIVLPWLVPRGNLKDLVSFCATHQQLYRRYSAVKESIHDAMLSYRVVPLDKMSMTYERAEDDDGFYRNSGSGGHCDWFTVVAKCDSVFSLTTTMCLYFREHGQSSSSNNYCLNAYYHQEATGQPFLPGIKYNDQVKSLLT